MLVRNGVDCSCGFAEYLLKPEFYMLIDQYLVAGLPVTGDLHSGSSGR
jgi:hypothetical protein